MKAKPRNFTFDDAARLLGLLSYTVSNKGKTSGSRIMFVSEEHPPILLHKQAAQYAAAHQMTLNDFVESSMKQALQANT